MRRAAAVSTVSCGIMIVCRNTVRVCRSGDLTTAAPRSRGGQYVPGGGLQPRGIHVGWDQQGCALPQGRRVPGHQVQQQRQRRLFVQNDSIRKGSEQASKQAATRRQHLESATHAIVSSSSASAGCQEGKAWKRTSETLLIKHASVSASQAIKASLPAAGISRILDSDQPLKRLRRLRASFRGACSGNSCEEDVRSCWEPCAFCQNHTSSNETKGQVVRKSPGGYLQRRSGAWCPPPAAPDPALPLPPGTGTLCAQQRSGLGGGWEWERL